MNPVLLIEDDPDIRTLVEYALAMDGIEVMSTSQGCDGLNALKTTSFSLVILDVMMPNMSGYEVLQHMAEMSRNDLPPVALFTARPEESTAIEAKKHGISMVLPKPFEPEQLVRAVEIDDEELEMLADAQDEMMEELRKSYLKSFPQKMSALSDAFASRDFESLTRLGHQLKGSGQSYGFPEISRLGQEIENAALITECTQLDAILTELENTMKRITESRTSK